MATTARGREQIWLFLLACSAAQQVSFRSVTEVRSATGTHFWFPQGWVSFEFGRILAVRVQLADDSTKCHFPHCSSCTKAGIPACTHAIPFHAMMLSNDYGSSWVQTNKSGIVDYPMSFGVAQLNPGEVLSTGGANPVDFEYKLRVKFSYLPRLPGSFSLDAPGTYSAMGYKLFSNAGSFSPATSSHDVVINSVPPSLNVTNILRWCDVIQLMGSNSSSRFAEIIQFDIGQPKLVVSNAAPTSPRMLAFTTSDDNFTFSYVSTIAKHSDPAFSKFSNGPCESALAEVPLPRSFREQLREADIGSSLLLAVFRVDSFAMYFHAVSLDGGQSWSTPQPLPDGIGSVRPRLRVVQNTPNDAPVVVLVGGRPGLMLWLGSLDGVVAGTHAQLCHSREGRTCSLTKLDSDVAIRWQWQPVNLAAAHNKLVPSLTSHFAPEVVNRTVYENSSLHGTTAYTSLIAVHQSPPGTSDTSFVLMYDRLAGGWRGPPGVYGNEDSVFAMRFDVGSQQYQQQEQQEQQKQQPLVLSDINIMVTTDLHSWVSGRPHEPQLNASIADMVNLVDGVRALARKNQQDLFLFDNGDINDGTGLSAFAGDHVAYLAPILQAVPYDALNCGNHELYQRNGDAGQIAGAACPIDALNRSGFVASWHGKYLTSNIVWKGSLTPVGSQYRLVQGEFGRRLLVFGFLYNMPDHCDVVDVLAVEDVVQSGWFLSALQAHAGSVDAVVVLAHMDYRDGLVDAIHSAIRGHTDVSQTIPIQFLTGHSHLRGWRRLDSAAASFEAGCKLDTVGFTSFSSNTHRGSGSGPVAFSYNDIDGNTLSFAQAINSTKLPASRAGASLQSKILSTRATLGIDRIVGQSNGTYTRHAAPSQKDSLWRFYMREIVPETVFKRLGNDPSSSTGGGWHILGTGALTYDLYEGPVTLGDAYKISPYANFYYKVGGVNGSVLGQILSNLQSDSADFTASAVQQARRGGAQTPSYVATDDTPAPSTLFDLIYVDFDAASVEDQLMKITQNRTLVNQRSVFWSGMNDSSIISLFFEEKGLQVRV